MSGLASNSATGSYSAGPAEVVAAGASVSRRRNADGRGTLFVIVGVHQSQLAIPCEYVRELLRIPSVNEVPGSPDYVRGVINLRGEVMPMIDLRKRLRLPSYGVEAERFVQMIEQRAEDHRRWLADLELALQEDRKFTLTPDPRECAFGKWYYSYKSDNVVLSSLLKSFEAPHSEIHALAPKAEALVAEGKRQLALTMVQQAKHTTLARLLQLFGRVGEVLKETQREMAVVIEAQGTPRVAISVDEVRTVETVNLAQTGGIEEGDAEISDPLLGKTLRRENNQGLVSLIEIKNLWHRSMTAPAPS